MEVTLQAVSLQAVTGTSLTVVHCEQLDKTNGLLTALIFILLFMWIEKKIKHITKKIAGGGVNG